MQSQTTTITTTASYTHAEVQLLGAKYFPQLAPKIHRTITFMATRWWILGLILLRCRAGVSHLWSWFLPALFCPALLTTITPSPVGHYPLKANRSLNHQAGLFFSLSSHLWEHLLLIRTPAERQSHTELLGPSGSFLGTTALISVGCIPQSGKGDGGGVGVLGE